MAGLPFSRTAGQPKTGDLLPASVSQTRSRFYEIQGKCRYLLANPAFRRSRVVTVSRLFWWRLHCALGIPATLSLPQWDARFCLPPRWHGAGTTMFYALRENYEKELVYLHRFISPGMVVIDGGANCGIYTVLAAKLVGPSGLVLSFEPGREAFSVLEKNVRLNRFQNVHAYHSALSDKEATAPLYHHRGSPNSYSLGAPDTTNVPFEEVTTRSLSQVVPEEMAQRIGLIKLDVEGAEELVLRGAGAMISRYRATIIFESNGVSARRLGLSPIGCWKLLESLGYRFFSLTDQGDLRELGHPPAPNEIVNIVAIHSGRPT